MSAKKFLSQADFDEELRRVLRRAQRLRAMMSGEATIEAIWRGPYKEKKIRSYKGHWVHIIKLNKPVKAATKRAAKMNIH